MPMRQRRRARQRRRGMRRRIEGWYGEFALDLNLRPSGFLMSYRATSSRAKVSALSERRVELCGGGMRSHLTDKPTCLKVGDPKTDLHGRNLTSKRRCRAHGLRVSYGEIARSVRRVRLHPRNSDIEKPTVFLQFCYTLGRRKSRIGPCRKQSLDTSNDEYVWRTQALALVETHARTSATSSGISGCVIAV